MNDVDVDSHALILRSLSAEGDIAAILEAVQKQYSGLSIGSYPFYNEQVFGTNVVLRARDEKLLDEAEAALREALGALAGNG